MTELTTMIRQLVQSSVARSRMNRNTGTGEKKAVQGAISQQEMPEDGSTDPAITGEVSDVKYCQEKAVGELNASVQDQKREIRFSIDEGSGRTIITVIDGTSKETIRQISPEAIIDVSRNLQNYASGIFVQVTV